MPPKIYHSVNTFNAGELSQLLFNREDISKYKSGCLTLENAFPLVEGGAKKMPGTYFAGSTLSNSHSRLVSFQFSTDQGAILEFSANAIRIWEPTALGTWTLGLVELGGSPIVLATPYTDADLFLLDCGTQSADTLWIFHPNYPPACVLRFGPSSWQYSLSPPNLDPTEPSYRGTTEVISTGFSGQGVPISLMTQAFPLVMVTASKLTNGQRIYINGCAGMVEVNEGEFWASAVTQSSDVAVFTGHIDDTAGTPGAGLILTVTAVSSGTILVGMQITGGNVQPNTIITALLSGSGGTGTYQVSVQQKVVSTGLTGTGGYAYNLIVANVSNFIATASISGTVMTVTAIIAGIIDLGVAVYFPGVVNGTVISSFGTGTGGVGTYNVSASQTAGSQTMSTVPVVSTAYLPYEGGGFAVPVVPLFAATGDYPACGTFYQGRLCVAGTDNNPTTLYGSVIDDYPDFICDPTEDDYAFQFTLVSNLQDQILSALGTPNSLLLGVASGVWAIASGSGTSISQSNFSSLKQSTVYGTGALQPQLVGDAAVFVSRSARVVTFLIYDFISNSWQPNDATRLNREITIGCGQYCSGILQTAFQSEPYPIFWAVRADGQLLGLVFNRQDQVYAWFRINMIPNGGRIESVAVISAANLEDMVVVSVNRTINGSTVRYVEYFYPQELFNSLSNAFFVHCGLQLNLGVAKTITGITNSNPPTVTAPGHNFANGSYVQISGVNGMVAPSNQPINQDKTQAYTVIGSNPGAGTFQLQGMDTTTWSPYVSGGAALPVTNKVSGLSYLLGQQVTAVGDSAVILRPTTVTSDTITFGYYCAQITIGIPYKMTVQPMNPVLTSPAATTHGMKQKLSRVTISLYQSLGGCYGVDLNHMYDITYGPGSVGGQP